MPLRAGEPSQRLLVTNDATGACLPPTISLYPSCVRRSTFVMLHAFFSGWSHHSPLSKDGHIYISIWFAPCHLFPACYRFLLRRRQLSFGFLNRSSLKPIHLFFHLSFITFFLHLVSLSFRPDATRPHFNISLPTLPSSLPFHFSTSPLSSSYLSVLSSSNLNLS